MFALSSSNCQNELVLGITALVIIHVLQEYLLYEGHPKSCGLDILDNNIFHNLYISEPYILYEL